MLGCLWYIIIKNDMKYIAKKGIFSKNLSRIKNRFQLGY